MNDYTNGHMNAGVNGGMNIGTRWNGGQGQSVEEPGRDGPMR